ncbi:hypothetical protein [Mucilaginibacter lacusdianchii]|uniref:hypothetical protein n=1 Tax=Mucilaginibacter lacusdianchii TaxID=2684211 RepID=UPI00131AD49B|nr:hypothetical protein [Mucilaginibacter sp. JXJ CY 39]
MRTENTPPSELYTTSRTQIQHYDMAIGQRLIWLNNSQAFMFGVYAVTVIIKSPTPLLAGKLQVLAFVIPILGLTTTLFTLFDIISSIVQMSKITRNYQNANNNSGKEANFPLLNGNLKDQILLRISPVISALLFLLVWGFLIGYDHQLI